MNTGSRSVLEDILFSHTSKMAFLYFEEHMKRTQHAVGPGRLCGGRRRLQAHETGEARGHDHAAQAHAVEEVVYALGFRAHQGAQRCKGLFIFRGLNGKSQQRCKGLAATAYTGDMTALATLPHH